MTFVCLGICFKDYPTLPLGGSRGEHYDAGFMRCSFCGHPDSHGLLILVEEGVKRCPCCNSRLSTVPSSNKARRRLREIKEKNGMNTLQLARA